MADEMKVMLFEEKKAEAKAIDPKELERKREEKFLEKQIKLAKKVQKKKVEEDVEVGKQEEFTGIEFKFSGSEV